MGSNAANGAASIDGYRTADAYDEAFEEPGRPRPHYAPLIEALSGTDLTVLARGVTRRVRAAGVAFGGGEDASEFVVDPLPRLVTSPEWHELEAGLAQRVRALDAFVGDVYGLRRIVEAGIVPEHVLAGIGFHEDDL